MSIRSAENQIPADLYVVKIPALAFTFPFLFQVNLYVVKIPALAFAFPFVFQAKVYRKQSDRKIALIKLGQLTFYVELINI